MASPAPPAYDDTPENHGDQIEFQVRDAEEGEDERVSGEWVGADHPKLQPPTTYRRWSEIEDTKDARLCANNTPITRSGSPATFAPEVRPLTPSCYAPEVLTTMRDEKMEVQEEKIYSPEEKIARPFSENDKILSPAPDKNADEEADKAEDKAEDKTVDGTGKPQPRTICGLSLRRFYTLVGIAFVILVAVIVAVSVTVSKHHSRKQGAGTRLNTAHSLKNPSMAALSWEDQKSIQHYKVYYQDESNSIWESSWNSTQTSPKWKHALVADPTMHVQPGSPLGAAAGWPHANYSYTLVKNVYYLGAADRIYERQARANNSNAWANDNLSGLYTAANLSSLNVYWTQNITNTSQALCVLFQEKRIGASRFTIGKYTSYGNISNEWVETKYNYTIQDGSPLSMARLSRPEDVLIYAVGEDRRLDQYRYNITTDDVTEFGSTDVVIPPKAVMAVAIQDNGPVYTTWGQRPECSRLLQYTHLVMTTTADASGLNLYSWNCSSGFVNQTSQITSLLRNKRHIFSLASHIDGKIYVRFDAGRGAEIEEWAVPKIAGESWRVTGNVTMGAETAKNGSVILSTPTLPALR
ncbi:hypothetical protein EG328_007293 [Venturia inaequalis]|uniref:Fucose-specific lectin n=1 Tax=Venturia inaequalis TaxID=5025 RepID=A0A8H3YSR8_VENIN|nr:hypothetical protein EG328_007293 [Venturia inaequalis]